MIAFSVLNLYTAIQQADFKKLLNGRDFLVVQGQLIFEKEGEVFITTIENNRDDFTVEDYMALPEGAPFQLINGKLVYMSSPKSSHQTASINLASYLNMFVKKNKLGRAFHAPFDVHLDEKNIYQPDLMFISNERMGILGDWVKGAPDFIVEILSWSTKLKDEGEKMENYGKYGVQEYWLIDPEKQTVEVYHNNNGVLILKEKFEKQGTLQSLAVAGFSVQLSDIFEE
ncbi:MAG: Uma2 family endonuclease [Bacteroidetes bacterium]|nr:Uma2 family endonuclease [Bacteroidota bacterium]